MLLLLDIGNQFIKWTTHDRIKKAWYKRLSCEDNFSSWQTLPTPKHILAACVAGNKTRQKIESWVQEKWGINITYVQVEQNIKGLTLPHLDLKKFGVDRWLALLAAWEIYHNDLIVIDCGTANTIDVILADGKYHGGWIIPGLGLMQQILNTHTAGIELKQIQLDHIKRFNLGYDTTQQIQHGVLLATTAYLNQAIKTVSELCQLSKPHCIITGGDAKLMLKHVTIACQHRPALVLEGLHLLSGQT